MVHRQLLAAGKPSTPQAQCALVGPGARRRHLGVHRHDAMCCWGALSAAGKSPHRTRSVHSSALVPGDIICVSTGTMPCDAVVLCGECIVDENMLTGRPFNLSHLQGPACIISCHWTAQLCGINSTPWCGECMASKNMLIDVQSSALNARRLLFTALVSPVVVT